MYDEGALDGLFDIFVMTDTALSTQDTAMAIDNSPDVPIPPPSSFDHTSLSVTSSQLFLSISTPLVLMELRRRKTSLLLFDGTRLNEQPINSLAFASIEIYKLGLSYVKAESGVTKADLKVRSWRKSHLHKACLACSTLNQPCPRPVWHSLT